MEDLSVSYQIFSDVTLTTFSNSVEGSGADIYTTSVGAAIASLRSESGTRKIDGKALMIIGTNPEKVWLAKRIEPEWDYQTLTTSPTTFEFRWAIDVDGYQRFYHLVFSRLADLQSFAALFQEARELALLAQLAGDRSLDEVIDDLNATMPRNPSPSPAIRTITDIPDFPFEAFWVALRMLAQNVITPYNARRPGIVPILLLLMRFLIVALIRAITVLSGRLVNFLQYFM